MAKITKDEVRYIAKLANLTLDEKEIEKMGKLLSEALEYIKIIDELDTDDVIPTAHVTGLKNVADKDEARPGLSQQAALSNGKNVKRGYFVTKGVLKKYKEV